MIAHVDADSFFASVLIRKNPHLRGKPVLALGMGGGCVIAASYEAKAKGVKTGMRLVDALALVPDALRMPSDFRETGLASIQIESILMDTCPIIEQTSIDEWYMDLSSMVGGVPKDLLGFTTDLRKRILQQTHLSVSVGVAPSKLLAKMAGEYRKPGGVTVIGSQDISREAFLRDRPAPAIPGIGHRRRLQTDARGWHTAWDIATADTDTLIELFGKPGKDMQSELKELCLSPVTVDHALPKSVSRCRSFKPTDDKTILMAHTLRHLEYTVLKMRRDELSCRGISVWLRDDRYEHFGANHSLPQPSNTEEQIRPFIESCFLSVYNRGIRYTQAGLALWYLVPTGQRQYSLFDDPSMVTKEENMQKTLDTIHERFGRDAISRATALPVKSGTKRGFELPIYE